MEVNIVNDFVVSKPDPVMIPDDAMKQSDKKEINVKVLVYIIVALAILATGFIYIGVNSVLRKKYDNQKMINSSSFLLSSKSIK